MAFLELSLVKLKHAVPPHEAGEPGVIVHVYATGAYEVEFSDLDMTTLGPVRDIGLPGSKRNTLLTLTDEDLLPTETLVKPWIRQMVEEHAEHVPLVVGHRYNHKGRVVEVVSGQYWGIRGISNYWTWREVITETKFGPVEQGYDTEGEFETL